MLPKVMVEYAHDPADTSPIYLAVVPRGASGPRDEDWTPVLRDTVAGRRVVWIRHAGDGTVWLRDRNGSREVRRVS